MRIAWARSPCSGSGRAAAGRRQVPAAGRGPAGRVDAAGTVAPLGNGRSRRGLRPHGRAGETGRPMAAALLLALLAAAAPAFARLSEDLWGLAPCELCLWQRWPYWAAAGAALAAAALPRARRPLLALAGAAVLASGAVAAFHLGVEARLVALAARRVPGRGAAAERGRRDRGPDALPAGGAVQALRRADLSRARPAPLHGRDEPALRAWPRRLPPHLVGERSSETMTTHQTGDGRLPGDPTPRETVAPHHPRGPRGRIRRQAHLPGPDRGAARHAVGAAAAPHAGTGAGTPRHLHPPDRRAPGAADGAAAAVAPGRLRPRRRHRGAGPPRRHGLHRCGRGSDRRSLRVAGGQRWARTRRS